MNEEGEKVGTRGIWNKFHWLPTPLGGIVLGFPTFSVCVRFTHPHLATIFGLT